MPVDVVVGGCDIDPVTRAYNSATVCSRSARSTGKRQSLNRFAYVLYLQQNVSTHSSELAWQWEGLSQTHDQSNRIFMACSM